MTNHEAMTLASECAQSLFQRDAASQAMGMRLLSAGPGCFEQSRSGRTGNYDVRIENQQGQLIALFHGKSYKVRGPVLAQENPNE